MIANLKRYPTTKDSGVEWLGEVPAHWEVLRLKAWLDVNQLVLPEDTDPDYTFDYVDIGSVATGQLSARPQRIRFGDSPSRARRVVRPGDTLVSTVRTYLKAVWHVEHSRADLIASTGFAVFTPRHGTIPKFMSYVFQSDPFTDRVTAESVGIAYPAIAETRLGTLEVCVPPLSEQAAIVRFLDHADRRIRRYIRRRHKLIALLNEYKQAIFHQAVTGQIDIRTGQRYPAYKSSGVDWLKDVPEHWERRRLKTLLRSVDQRSSTGGETLLSLRRDHGVVVYAEHFSRPPQARSLVGFKLVATDQLVVNRMQANNGLIFCSSLEGLVSPDYSVFETKIPIQTKFLSDLLRTPEYLAHFRRSATGLGTGTAGFLRLYDDRFLDTIVFLPPNDEQGMILNELSNRIAMITALIDTERKALRRIDEYRTRLVAEVVTGKLDVREAIVSMGEVDPLEVEDSQEVTLRRDAESDLHEKDRIAQEMET